MTIESASIDGHYRLASESLAIGDVGVAEALLNALIAARPSEGRAHNLLGAIAYGAGKDPAAAEHFAQAIRLDPENGDYYSDLALVLSRMGAHGAAITGLRASIHLKPDGPAAHNNLGNELRYLGRFDDAAVHYAEAIRLKPDFLEAHNNLGTVYCYQGRLEEAKTSYLKALSVNPNCADLHNNLGLVFQQMDQHDLAARAYRNAIRLDPQTTEAAHNLAILLLLQGDYAEGWRLYEKRGLCRQFALGVRSFTQPMWNGELEPKRLLIYADQGLGDSLQFCRYLPLIDPRHEIIFEVQAPLVDLMRQLPGVDVIARGETLPDFDAHCSIMSLPFIFGTTLDTIPNQTPYLRAAPVKVARWSKRLEPAKGLRVGLVWAGGARQNRPELEPMNGRRSMTLSALAPLAKAAGVSFVSLQKGPPASEAHAPPPGMTLFDFTAELHDFTDTAALVETLDLVISVDTAVAHLAAAMGKPVWLLNRFDTCWRWLMNRDDSPWYPTLRLFRQPAPGDWSSVTADIAAALQGAADQLEDRQTAMVRAA
jgi:Flp pilus assembly protein TadD